MELDHLSSPITIRRGIDGMTVIIDAARLRASRYRILFYIGVFTVFPLLYYALHGLGVMQGVGQIYRLLGLLFLFFLVRWAICRSRTLLPPYDDRPLQKWHYVIGLALPSFIVGFCPLVYGLVASDIAVYLVGLVYLAVGFGDFIVIHSLRFAGWKIKIIERSFPVL